MTTLTGPSLSLLLAVWTGLLYGGWANRPGTPVAALLYRGSVAGH